MSALVVGLGGYSYTHINVEAYPDPAPAIIELIAQNPGTSAEEMERLVTVPLEVDSGRHAQSEDGAHRNRSSACRMCAAFSSTAILMTRLARR